MSKASSKLTSSISISLLESAACKYASASSRLVLGYIGSNTADTFTAEFAVGFPGYTVADLFTNLPLDEPFCGNIDASGTPTVCDPFPALTATPEPSDTLLLAGGLLAVLVVLRPHHHCFPGQLHPGSKG